MSDESEMWETYKEIKKAKDLHSTTRNRFNPSDLEMLEALIDNGDAQIYKINSDGSDGQIYVINLITPFGTRLVDFWNKTSRWRARKGQAFGTGVVSMARYYKLSKQFE